MIMSMTQLRSPAAFSRHDLQTRQAVVLACAAMVVVSIGDIVLDGKLGSLFSVGFILIAVTVPLSVGVRSLFAPGILPPLLMIGMMLVFAIIAPSTIPADALSSDAGTLQRFIAGIIDQATALVVGHLLALGIIGLRILTDPERS